MCFSATASFGAGIVLAAIGAATLTKAKSPQVLLFAGIPLIFSVQQIMEGFLWLALSNPTYSSLQSITTYVFLFIAQVVWPFWIPFAILKLEKKAHRGLLQKILVGVGAIVSLYLCYCLVFHSVEAGIIGYHISYEQNYPPAIRDVCGLLYIIATIVPSYLSSIKRMWIFGTAVLLSYILTTIFYTDYVVSVWCFFASVISISVGYILFGMDKVDIGPVTTSVSLNGVPKP